MRCHFHRWMFFLILILLLIILYQSYTTHSDTWDIKEIQLPFRIIHHENRTYRILSPAFRYDSRGSYLNFAHFNVEQRSRVLRIDGRYDVPVSSQWNSTGHLYPTQIVQFGLSHWSRIRWNSKSEKTSIQTIERLRTDMNDRCSPWHSFEKKIFLSNSFLQFSISTNCSLYFQFSNSNVELAYSTMRATNNDDARFFIRIEGAPRHVNRHLLLDMKQLNRKRILNDIDLIRVRVCGSSGAMVNRLQVGNRTSYDEEAFYSAVRWLLNTQDEQTGCWLIRVKTDHADRHHYRLRMPWCSAMAQGQAASLLIRLYSRTHDVHHLSAIHRAIHPLWSSNSSRAYFNNRFLWLEEYPFEPPAQGLFVLNGCLYALLGIIDVHSIDPQPHLAQLIEQILQSLHHMLPFYIHPNVNNWSLYDLSHLTMKSTVINVASYSYHLVHITLLQCLSEIFKRTDSSSSRLFDTFAKRFQSAVIR